MLHCPKGIWLHPYTVTLAKLAPDLIRQGHLRSENDIITSWLRPIPTSYLVIHPYYTYIYIFKHWHWYAVARAYGCTHTVTRAKLAPDLVHQGHLRSENDVITAWLRPIPNSKLFIHPY